MDKNFEDYLSKLAPTVAASAKPTILLLQCIDWRYAHRIVDMMDRMGLRGKYDVFALAGAAGGANKVDEWRDALISHIETARKIEHHIDHIIILEHRDCGAYKFLFGLDWEKTLPPEELKEHQDQVRILANYLDNHFRSNPPALTKIDAFLLARDEDDPLPI